MALYLRSTYEKAGSLLLLRSEADKINTPIDLSGAIISSSEVVGSLIVTKELSGLISSASDTTASLYVTKELSGLVPSVSVCRGTLYSEPVESISKVINISLSINREASIVTLCTREVSL